MIDETGDVVEQWMQDAYNKIIMIYPLCGEPLDQLTREIATRYAEIRRADQSVVRDRQTTGGGKRPKATRNPMGEGG